MSGFETRKDEATSGLLSSPQSGRPSAHIEVQDLTLTRSVRRTADVKFLLRAKPNVLQLFSQPGLSEMPGKQAKTLSADHIDDLLFFAERSRHPLRNRLIVLLSVKAGLRAAEIAKLSWDMVLDPSGAVGGTLALQDQIAKKRSGRTIPIHADLRQALVEARQLCNGHGPIVRSERGGALTPMTIVVWFNRAYKELGFEGCSSHSGRRTFITRAARAVHKAGGSLRDVQLLAGHRSIQTTQRYIDGDSDAQRRLISLI
jgi:integrase